MTGELICCRLVTEVKVSQAARSSGRPEALKKAQSVAAACWEVKVAPL